MSKANKRYCCYRHFIQGKSAKDSTYCYNHVSLGSINPIHNSPQQPKQLVVEGLNVKSKPFRIENRTHDYNEIQHKQTLPQRLVQPRVYIEKIVGKGSSYVPFLGMKSTGAQQFDSLMTFYEKIGKIVKSKKELEETIREFQVEKSLSLRGKDFLLLKKYFIGLVTEKFRFSEEEGELFWEIAYNDKRFQEKQAISSKAFVYNFGKYYLDNVQNFKNMFSSHALRQRLIDIRVLLHNWQNLNIFLKENLRSQKTLQLQMCTFFKRNLGEELFFELVEELQARNKTYFTMRTLAKCFYPLTDSKNFSYQKMRNTVIEKIQEKSKILDISKKMLQKFMETNEISNQSQFPITEILQFLRLEGISEGQMSIMVKWMRGIFKYLFYHKGHPQLSFNLNTMKIQCTSLIRTNLDLIRQYQSFTKNQCDDFVKVLGEFMEYLDHIVKMIPELTGPKKSTVECNYVSESLLRFLQKISLQPFYKIDQIINTFLSTPQNVNEYRDIFQQKPQKQFLFHYIKNLFTFQSQQQPEEANNIELKTESNYDLAIEQYFSISKGIKEYKPLQKEEKQKTKEKQEKFQTVRSSQKNEDRQSEFSRKMEKDLLEMVNLPEQEVRVEKVNHRVCLRECCHKVSEETTESISTVEGLQSHLMDLLNM